MATNKPIGDGHRNGMVRRRSQTKDGLFGRQTKRDLTTGQFIDKKKAGGNFKGARHERWSSRQKSLPPFRNASGPH